jgi:hypothetical protein
LPLPAPQLRQARDTLFRARIPLLLSDRDPEGTIPFVESSDIAGRPSNVIEISEEGVSSVRLWVETATGEILKSAYEGAALAGAGSIVEELYSDYRNRNGVRQPFKTRIFQSGKLFLEVEVSAVECNGGLNGEQLAAP